MAQWGRALAALAEGPAVITSTMWWFTTVYKSSPGGSGALSCSLGQTFIYIQINIFISNDRKTQILCIYRDLPYYLKNTIIYLFAYTHECV